jgi:hypothetical protein
LLQHIPTWPSESHVTVALQLVDPVGTFVGWETGGLVSGAVVGSERVGDDVGTLAGWKAGGLVRVGIRVGDVEVGDVVGERVSEPHGTLMSCPICKLLGLTLGLRLVRVRTFVLRFEAILV